MLDDEVLKAIHCVTLECVTLCVCVCVLGPRIGLEYKRGKKDTGLGRLTIC